MTQLSALIQGSGKNAIDKRSYTATAAQTAFAVTYTPPYVDVYQNGVRLNAADYTATSGTSVTLGVGAALNDEIEVIGFSSDASITASYSGSTAPAVPIEGMMWYDTTDGALYVRTGGFWVEASQAGATQGIQGIQGPPGDGVIISGITVTDASYANTDDTAVSLTGGYIKVTGTGFVSGCTVVVGSVIATSVTFISSTEVRAQLPALAAGTYILYVSNPSGAVAIRVNAITFSALPTWVSTSPLPNGTLNTAISTQLSGTSDSAITYSLQSGSTLPTGLTLSSSGLLSGTVTGISSDTTFNFTVVATDAELQDSPKAFSITITVLYVVARSLRFRASASAYLSKTPATATNRTTWTWSAWVKRGTLGVQNPLFFAGTAPTDYTLVLLTSSDGLGISQNNAGSSIAYITSSALFRDPAAWYHIVAVWNSTSATATLTGTIADRMQLWVNGVQLNSFNSSLALTQNTNSFINNNVAHYHALYPDSSPTRFDGEMAEINFVDGQALTPASFGQVSVTSGAWIPKAYAGTYGTNGFCLKFADNSANTAAAIGKDSSTNGNNWTPTNISLTAGDAYDSLLDSPVPSSTTVGNYCVLNPLAKSSNLVLSNGNLKYTANSTAYASTNGTIQIPNTGKWYFEAYINSLAAYSLNGTQSSNIKIGIIGSDGQYALDATDSNGLANYSISSPTSGSYDVAGLGSSASGNTMMVAYDAATGKLWLGAKGSWSGGGNPATGTTPTYTTAGTLGSYIPRAVVFENTVASANFGQRSFTYTPPTDFLALNTYNLPASAVLNPATAMAATTYTGTGATQTVSNAVNAVGMQPDLVWIKNRSAVNSHQLVDSIRGVTKYLFSDATAADDTRTDQVTAFSSSGFSLSALVVNTAVNNTGNNYVAWQWKAGSTVSANNNTAGTITSTVSANQAAGFSVVTYTGTGANATVGHGLGVAPGMVIIKSRSIRNWIVYHSSLTSAAYYLSLNQTIAQTSLATVFNSTAPTNAVFSIGTDGSVNASAETYVAYCWAPVAGYSKFGSYTGNGSADGTFVYTGFKPRWLMIKCSSGVFNWFIEDSSRNTTNVTGLDLGPHLSDAEINNSPTFDFLSNGFKLRNTYTSQNGSGSTYIYAAFAETPFNFATAR